MYVANSKIELIDYIETAKQLNNSLKINFVPTMGALHKGHLQLIKQAKETNNLTIVSIFVNPLQFNDLKDFQTYPQTLTEDLILCQSYGVDLVFCPKSEDVYNNPLDQSFLIEPPTYLTNTLCGLQRLNHFTGVATVVLKLFNIVKPNIVFMGLKDYQQYLIIQNLCKDLFLDIEIIGVETVREEDGLALSSRNKLLSEENRKLAPILYRTLIEMKTALLNGGDVDFMLKQNEANLKTKIDLEYLTIVSAGRLIPLTQLIKPALIAIAAKFGNVRLIDNVLVSN